MSRLIDDLAKHVLDKHGDTMSRTLSLLDDQEEKFGLMVSVIASELMTFATTLAKHNPMLRNLSPQQQLQAMCHIILRAVDASEPSVQEQSDIMAAIDVYPGVCLA